MNMSISPHLFKCHGMLNINIVKSNDCILYDDQGRAYLDFEAGIWCTNIGHTHPAVVNALQSQCAKVMHLHTLLPNHLTEALAIKLTELCHMPDGYATFLSSGSEAVQLGLTIAQLIHPNGKIIALGDSYFAAYKYMRLLPHNPNWTFIDYSSCSKCMKEHCHKDCSIFSSLDLSSYKIFALELGSASGKNIFPAHKLVSFIEDVIRENGGIIISNEVTSGFGRTGKWFAHRHYEIQPDIIAMGKALGNGYPVSALVMNHLVGTHNVLSDFKYVQSHQNDPLGCIVANTVLDTIVSENLIQLAKETGTFFKAQLNTLKESFDCISDVRGEGLMLVLEFKDKELSSKVFYKLLENGFFVGNNPIAGLLRFYPPLTIKQEHIIALCQAIRACIEEL